MSRPRVAAGLTGLALYLVAPATGWGDDTPRILAGFVVTLMAAAMWNTVLVNSGRTTR